MSNIIELIEVQNVIMCPNCKGKGKDWTDIEFGDSPTDSRYKRCRRCDGTGRVVVVLAKCEMEIPFNAIQYCDRGKVSLVTVEEIKN